MVAVTGRDLWGRWQRTRSALAICLLMSLIVVGGAGRLVTPAPAFDQPAPKGVLVDGHAASEHGVRPGQAGLRLAPDLRPPHPALDGGSPSVLVASQPVTAWANSGRTTGWSRPAAPLPATERLAHAPRGPPVPANVVDPAGHSAGGALSVSWNRGPILRQGLHRT